MSVFAGGKERKGVLEGFGWEIKVSLLFGIFEF
jgi:hypothetical protein